MKNEIVLEGILINDIKLIKNKAIGRLVSNHFYKTKSGEKKERSIFIDLDFWNDNAEIANNDLKKGQRISLTGKLSLDEWEDKFKEKKSRYYIKVINFEILI